jgi:serine/threonine protein kinase
MDLDKSERSVSFRMNSSDDGEHEFRSHPPSPPPPASNSPKITPKKCREQSPPESPGGTRREDNSPRFSSAKLRSNLMREQIDRDPLFFYETVKTLGVGSMGSVARVKRRTNVIGGSARKDIQDAVRRQKKEKSCLEIPLIGGLFRFCFDGKLKHSTSRNALTDSISHSLSSTSAIGLPCAPCLEYSGKSEDHISNVTGSTRSYDSTTKSSQEILYAMKSIHLNRVTDTAFVTELKNEISILKELDHPHIVRAIETFEHRNQIFIVMELCSGGDLYSRDPYKEEEAARIISSILSAISYMHSKNMAHRDLKYE